MKKNNIKKRLAALRSGLMLSLCVISPFSIFKADTYYKGYTTQYGSYSLIATNIFDNQRTQSLFMYSLNGVYNGRVRIYYTTASYNGCDSIIPINCTIESRSDSYLQVTFKNVSEFAIIFQNAPLNPIDITSVQYPGDTPMTKITNGTNNQLETIETILYNIQSTNQTIATNTAGISTTNTRLTTLNNNVNNILTQISNYFTTNNGTTINIGDIILQFNEFNAQLQLQLGILNDLKTALLDIDNKIDTITWVDSSRTVNISPTNSSNWENISNNSATVTFSGSLNYSSIGSDRQVMYKLTVPLSITNLSNNIIVTMFNGNKDVSNNILYVDYNSYQIVIYFGSNFDGSANNLTVNVQSSGNYLRYTRPDLVPSTIQFITENDIEYWELYNSFIQFKKFDAILNAINNITIPDYSDVLQDIIDAINNINIQYNVSTEIETEIETSIENINDINIVIENNIDAFNNNKTSILNRIGDLETTHLQGVSNAYQLLMDHVFINDLRHVYGTYLWYMLFGVLIVMLLG